MSLTAFIAVASAAATAALTPSAQANVTSYAAAFFASHSPDNAMDMVSLLPGFTFDRGDQVRGFGGAAGNVLIDGERPAAKDDPLDLILTRIPASSVLRIDVIRGGAPGVDMHGKTVIANVIRRTDAGNKLTLTASDIQSLDGRPGAAIRAEGSGRVGKTTYEYAMKLAHGLDDGGGDGHRVRTDASGSPVLISNFTAPGAFEEDRLSAAMETPVAGGKLRLSGSFTSQPYASTTTDHLVTPPQGRNTSATTRTTRSRSSVCAMPAISPRP